VAGAEGGLAVADEVEAGHGAGEGERS
jgi:hypothetical protein